MKTQYSISMLLAAMSIATASLSSAAIVSVVPLQAEYSGLQTSGTAEDLTTVDLSAGLKDGQDVAVTLTVSNPLIWTGVFNYDGGFPVTLDFEASLELWVGGIKAGYKSTSEEWNFFQATTGGTGSQTVAGYVVGPHLNSLSVTVPWGTDLSDVEITLSQTSSISGQNASFSLSKVEFLGNLSLEAVNIPASSGPSVFPVPEPGIELLGCLAFVFGLVRRHRSE